MKLKSTIPNKPGVYFFKKGKDILYIGKATNLKSRVASYFSKDIEEKRGPLISKMIEEQNKVEFQVTDSVLESVILEANLIKKYQPIYNTKEKSNKSFYNVIITDEPLPRVILRRERDLVKESGLKIKNIFGPFPNGEQIKEALKIIRKIFPFFDQKSNQTSNLNFYKQINLNPESAKEYKENIKKIKLLFQGKKTQIIKSLEKEMNKLAKLQEFEKANLIKRQIFSLKHIRDVSLIKKENINNQPIRIEAYDIAHMSGKDVVGVMTVVFGGELSKGQYRKFKIKEDKNNDTGALKEVLRRRLKHQDWKYPDLIVVDGGKAQINATKKVLEQEFSLNINVVSVVKDEKHKPKNILGDSNIKNIYEAEILMANKEAHRFAIEFYRKRSRNIKK